MFVMKTSCVDFKTISHQINSSFNSTFQESFEKYPCISKEITGEKKTKVRSNLLTVVLIPKKNGSGLVTL